MLYDDDSSKWLTFNLPTRLTQLSVAAWPLAPRAARTNTVRVECAMRAGLVTIWPAGVKNDHFHKFSEFGWGLPSIDSSQGNVQTQPRQHVVFRASTTLGMVARAPTLQTMSDWCQPSLQLNLCSSSCQDRQLEAPAYAGVPAPFGAPRYLL